MADNKAAPSEGHADDNILALTDRLFVAAWMQWTAAIRHGCAAASSWPEKLGAGIYAGTAYLIEQPEAARELFGIPHESPFGKRYREAVGWASQLVGEVVPLQPKAGPDAPAAAIAGALLLIAQEVRLARPDRLAALRRDVHLLILLPYLDFAEAQRWVETVYMSLDR